MCLSSYTKDVAFSHWFSSRIPLQKSNGSDQNASFWLIMQEVKLASEFHLNISTFLATLFLMCNTLFGRHGFGSICKSFFKCSLRNTVTLSQEYKELPSSHYCLTEHGANLEESAFLWNLLTVSISWNSAHNLHCTIHSRLLSACLLIFFILPFKYCCP